MRYCPYCGAEVDEDSIYCLKCGKKFPEKTPPKGEPAWEPRPTGSDPQVTYHTLYQSKPYHIGMKAPLGERCIASLLDDAVEYFIPCFGCVYGCIKDGIREGQSLGKGFMGLRVIDFQTGIPATIGQSAIRNLCGCLDVCTCYLAVLIDQDGRRIGDKLAGTVVILDQ